MILSKSLGFSLLGISIVSPFVLSQTIVPIDDQIAQLNQTICLQNWAESLRQVNFLIGSPELSNEQRSFYVSYRRTLQNYLDRNTRLENMPGCETIAPLPESPEPTPTESSPPIPEPSESLSNFDWESEVSKIQRMSQTSQARNTASLRPTSTTSAPSRESTEMAEQVLKEEQGIFFRPIPRSNIPAANIQGSLLSYLPIEATNIEVHYQVYTLTESNSPNTDRSYRCSDSDRFMLTGKMAVSAQRSVFIEAPSNTSDKDQFVQVVGVTWQENSDRAFVRVSQFPSSSNVVSCGTWYPTYYSSFRQAVDPQIGLR